MREECEDGWASHGVQVMVEWPDTPRAPWPCDSWLCVALEGAGGWGSRPGLFSSPSWGLAGTTTSG